MTDLETAADAIRYGLTALVPVLVACCAVLLQGSRSETGAGA